MKIKIKIDNFEGDSGMQPPQTLNFWYLNSRALSWLQTTAQAQCPPFLVLLRSSMEAALVKHSSHFCFWCHSLLQLLFPSAPAAAAAAAAIGAAVVVASFASFLTTM